MKTRKILFEDHPMLPFEEWDANMGETPSPGPKSIPEAKNGQGARKAQPAAEKKDPADRLLYYLSFGSGSSGNCCYVGTRHGGVLVDAGVRADIVEDELAAAGIRMSDVKAILLTHDHGDHVRYAYTLLRSHRHLKLLCTNRVLNGLLRRHSISRRIREYHVPIFKEIPFKVYDFKITAFEVPHDGTDNMGFSMEFDDRHFVIATDLGAVSERARHYISEANYLVMESNYDARMLRDGRYPEYLKARIMTANGHMDNEDTARFLAEVVHPGLSHIFLCHLSKDNNTPAKALKATRDALEARGLRVGRCEDTLEDRRCDVQLMALPRFDATRLFVFRPGNPT